MSADHKHRVCTYEEAEKAIRTREKVYVNDCFCRGPAREGKAAWKYCGHTVETCMGFSPPSSEGPQYPYKKMSQREALGLFEDWKKQGHFFRFMADEQWICFCCACGCGFFRDEKGNKVQDPCDKGAFIESTDADQCTLCGACLDVCAWEARSIDSGAMIVEPKKCYGCSACQQTCPVDAIVMVAR